MTCRFVVTTFTAIALATMLGACEAPVSASYRGIRPGMPCVEALASEETRGSKLVQEIPTGRPGDDRIKGQAYRLRGTVGAHESEIEILCTDPSSSLSGTSTVWSLLTTTAFDSEADAVALYELQVTALTRPDDKPEIKELLATPAQAASRELLDPHTPIWRSARWGCSNARAWKKNYFQSVEIDYPRRKSPKFTVYTFLKRAGECI
jgi:hypothetical protein